MSKKTLKHAVDGKVFTRKTARDYTHVLLVKRNLDLELANAKAALASIDEKKILEHETYEHNYRKMILAAPVGSLVMYHRNQGGAYQNRRGPSKVVEQWNKDFYAQYPDQSIEDAVAEEIQDRKDRINARINAIYNEATCNQGKNVRWEVTSWHSRRDLAEKAAAGMKCFTRVEEINGGVE